MSFMLCGSKRLNASMDSLALQESRQAFMAENNLPEVNQDIEWMDAFCVIVPRGKKGFGFTVTGSCPVRIGQVKEGSPACTAGLQKDDAIVKINGKNVSRSIADTVAKIVRTAESEVTLECYRATPHSMHSIHEEDQCVPNEQSPNSNFGAGGQIWSPYSPPEDFERRLHQHNQQQQRQRHKSSSLSPNQQVPNSEERHPLRSSAVRSDFSVQSSPPCLYHIQAEIHATNHKLVGAFSEVGGARAMSENDWQGHEEGAGQRTSTPTRLQSISCMDLNNDLHQQQTSAPQERGSCIQRLFSLEAGLVSTMQFGIERYLQPLRYSVIAPAEHTTLFQNIERLVAMADFNAQLLKKNCSVKSEEEEGGRGRGEEFEEIPIGALYQRHVPMLCEAYESYCAGAKSAIRLLAELKKDPAFQTFLQEPPLRQGQPTLGTFLQRPLQHMKELVMQLQTIYTNTPSLHQDQTPLKQVIQALRRSCSAIYQQNTRLCRSTFSLASLAPSTTSLHLHNGSSISSRIPSPLRECHGDAEAEESTSICSFRSKTFSDHSDSSEKSVKSHHSQDSGISVRKSSSEGETLASGLSSANNSPSSSTGATPSTSSSKNNSSGFPHNSKKSSGGFQPTGTLCHRCKKDKRKSSAGARGGDRQVQQQVPQQVQQQVQAAPSVIQSIHSDRSEIEVSSIDSEVLDIQSRLLFGNDIGSFRIASSTRHMIYAGDLLYQDTTIISTRGSSSSVNGWTEVYVVLLSDLLLVTRVEEDNYLTVLEEPIVLQDIASATWTCNHECEFQLTILCEECCDGEEDEDDDCRTVLSFRAPCTELKHTWQNIVDQRIVACHTQPERDEAYGKVLAEFI